jgi:sulfite exporter TauE/SafE
LQAAYHGGRLVSYALLGAICGILGAAADLGGSMVGLHRLAAFLAGGMMVLVGIVAVLRHSGLRVPMPPLPGFLQRVVVVGQRAAMSLAPLPRALSIGLLSALLPCGWLYAFAIIAAGTGSGLWGAAILTAFWLGTVPVLASLGIGVQAFTGTLGRRIPLVTAVAIVLLGLYTIVDRLAVPVQAIQPNMKSAASESTMEQLEAVKQAPPPCCQNRGE